MRHYSRWVIPREMHHPSFDDLPPLLLEYKAVDWGIDWVIITVHFYIGMALGPLFGDLMEAAHSAFFHEITLLLLA